MISRYYNIIRSSLMKFADNNTVQLILFIAFFVILEFEYYDFINIPLYRERMGFDFEFSIYRFLFSNIAFVFLILLNKKFKNFDFFINSLFLVFLTIPSLVFYEFMPNTPIAISLFMLLFHALYYYSTKLEISYPLPDLTIKEDRKLMILFSIILLSVIPFLIDYGFIINTKAFITSEVYNIREIGSAKLTMLTGYLYGWIVRILIPVAFIISLTKKKYLFALLFLIIQIYLYSLLAQKLVFVTLFIALLMFIKSYYRQVTWVLFSVIGVIVLSKLISILTGNIIVESIIVRRTFFIPTIITSNYLEFFNDNYVYWSNSVLKMFGQYPYDVSPNLLIGTEYYDGVIKSANTGFLGDGFMNFGYLGMLFNVVSVVIVFKLFSLMKISSDYSGVFIIIIYTLVNGYFFTSLLTHGIIILLLTSFFVLRNTSKEQ